MAETTYRKLTPTVARDLRRILQENAAEIAEHRARLIELDFEPARRYGKPQVMNKEQEKAERKRLGDLIEERDAACVWIEYELAKREGE